MDTATIVVCPACHCSECKVEVTDMPDKDNSIYDVFIQLSCPSCHQIYTYFDLQTFSIH